MLNTVAPSLNHFTSHRVKHNLRNTYVYYSVVCTDSTMSAQPSMIQCVSFYGRDEHFTTSACFDAYYTSYEFIHHFIIILNFLFTKKYKVHPRTGLEGPEDEQRNSSFISLTSALDAGGWLTSRPSRFILGKETLYPLYRRLGGP